MDKKVIDLVLGKQPMSYKESKLYFIPETKEEVLEVIHKIYRKLL